MNKRCIAFVATVLTGISLIGPPAASAATEFGDNCVANTSGKAAVPTTLFALTAAGNPLSLTAPSAGVITKWKFNLAPEATGITIPQTLKVLRQTGPLSVQVIGESTQNVTGGANSSDTRIPVQAGDRLALFAATETFVLYCEVPGPINRLAAFEGGAGVGSSGSFIEVEDDARIPAFAVIEPDADNDGFGDETQDKCPQSAAAQAACPVIALSASAIAKKGLVTVLITSGTQAPVTVTGTAKLGKGKTAKLNGGTQVVAPGTIARFTLLFPKSLRSKLKQLSPKQRLTLNLTATAVNVTGQPSTTPLKAKLKGQAKPKPKKPRRQAKS
jgi:hypothetical protein